jgi:K+-transporting ATPase A subunit
MTKNMGLLDRGIRTVIALLIAVLIFTGQVGGVLAVILGIVAVVFLVTSFVSRCPAYLPFNISTRKRGGEGGQAGGGSAGV